MFYIHIAPLGLCWLIGAVRARKPDLRNSRQKKGQVPIDRGFRYAEHEEKPSFEVPRSEDARNGKKTRFLFQDLEVWEVQGLIGEDLFIGG